MIAHEFELGGVEAETAEQVDDDGEALWVSSS